MAYALQPQPTTQSACEASAVVSIAATRIWVATGLERPVFLDESGRRRSVVGLLAALVALCACVGLLALSLAPVGFASLPALDPQLAQLAHAPAPAAALGAHPALRRQAHRRSHLKLA